MDERMRRPSIAAVLQCDEIWCFREARSSATFAKMNRLELGDQWIYVALDADTKLIPSFLRRKAHAVENTMRFHAGRADVASADHRVQLTTDGLSSSIAKPLTESLRRRRGLRAACRNCLATFGQFDE